MKRVLITGASGFVGANLARRLLRDGHELHLLVRPAHNAWRIEAIRNDVRLHEVVMNEDESVHRAVGAIRPDWVFHLAAHGAYSSQTSLAEMIATNIQGTVNLVQACLKHGFEAFINTGSSSEYGWKDHAPAESECPEPNSHYAVTKAFATNFCRYTAQSRKMPLITLRLYSVYGPYEDPGRLIPTLVMHGREGRLPPLVNPNTARDYVFADDVNEACILAASSADQELGAVYNLGTGEQTSLAQVVEVARKLMDIPAEPSWGSMPQRHWDTDVWLSDNRKITRQLGWRPRHSFTEGLGRMIEWLSDNPEMRAFYKARIATDH